MPEAVSSLTEHTGGGENPSISGWKKVSRDFATRGDSSLLSNPGSAPTFLARSLMDMCWPSGGKAVNTPHLMNNRIETAFANTWRGS